MTEVRYITNSEVMDYQLCKRDWAIGYVLQMGPTREHVHEKRERGAVVHSVFEDYYNGQLKGDPVDMAASFAFHAASLRARYDDSEEDQPAIDKALKYAESIVGGYEEWLAEEGEDSDLQILSAEEEVMAPVPGLGDANILLLGKLDARFLRQRDGARIGMDHKVVQNFPDITKHAHLSTQFKHYMLLERLTLDKNQWSDGMVINMARAVLRSGNAAPPFYGRHEVRHSDETLRVYWQQLVRTIKEMLELEDKILTGKTPLEEILPTPTRDCSWRCSFFHGCPMVDDGSDWNDYVNVSFTHRPPLERYRSIGAPT